MKPSIPLRRARHGNVGSWRQRGICHLVTSVRTGLFVGVPPTGVYQESPPRDHHHWPLLAKATTGLGRSGGRPKPRSARGWAAFGPHAQSRSPRGPGLPRSGDLDTAFSNSLFLPGSVGPGQSHPEVLSKRCPSSVRMALLGLRWRCHHPGRGVVAAERAALQSSPPFAHFEVCCPVGDLN